MEILAHPEIVELLKFLSLLGVAAGFLAGLLGIGGGGVFVPGLFFVFNYLGYSEDVVMHMALGTSLAIIFPTGLISAFSHYKRGGVDIPLVRSIGIVVVSGALLGSYLASYLSGFILALIFTVVVAALTLVMMVNPSKFKLWQGVPGAPWPALAGLGIGNVSSLIGIGGATLTVPFLTLCHIPIARAVGTAAALGVLISLPAALGYALTGLDIAGRPPISMGYISLPALAFTGFFSALTAPLGVCIAHKIPPKILKAGFALFMISVCIKMGTSLL